jgi:hypothetical protein
MSVIRDITVGDFARNFLVIAVFGLLFAFILLQLVATSEAVKPIRVYTHFAWNCFFKPHTGGNRNQQDALESFYKAQAGIYDATRVRLLRGREDMLGLVAAQLKQRSEDASSPSQPTWVDVCLTSDTTPFLIFPDRWRYWLQHRTNGQILRHTYFLQGNLSR